MTFDAAGRVAFSLGEAPYCSCFSVTEIRRGYITEQNVSDIIPQMRCRARLLDMDLARVKIRCFYLGSGVFAGGLQFRKFSYSLNMQSITPFLWFDDRAEEAMNFYVSIFPNSKRGRITRYGKAGPGPKDTVMTVEFELQGQRFIALNGGPQFQFNEAVSFAVNCETQEEIDYFWEKLGDGGQTGPCGWLKDKFGLSWQISPVALEEMLSDPDSEKADRVMRAMLEMDKMDISKLQRAYEQ